MTTHRRTDRLTRSHPYACDACKGTGVRLPAATVTNSDGTSVGPMTITDRMLGDMLDLADRIVSEENAAFLESHPITELPEPLRTAAENGDASLVAACYSYLAAVR